MKFGTFHLFQKPPGWTDEDVFRTELEQIEKAEALGFDAVWLAEHHFQWYGIATDLMVIAGWVAARTRARPHRHRHRRPSLPQSYPPRRAGGDDRSHERRTAGLRCWPRLPVGRIRRLRPLDGREPDALQRVHGGPPEGLDRGDVQLRRPVHEGDGRYGPARSPSRSRTRPSTSRAG